jgi:hypothetical protein
MPLVIKAAGDVSKPVVICDHCGEEIAEARQGNYQWRMSDAGKGIEGRVYFTHKHCCHAFEQVNPDPCWGSMELECLPVYLANNLGIDWKKANRTAGLMASM